MKFFKSLFCKHSDWRWIRSIYGDEINRLNGNRSEWQCIACGKLKLTENLFSDDSND